MKHATNHIQNVVHHLRKKLRNLIYILTIITFFSCNRKSGELDLCGLGILKPYYLTGLDYQGGLFAIKEKYKEEYIPVKKGQNSGIVKIQFDVNCEGETGNFEFETYNLKYESITMNDSITNQTVSIAKKLNNWIPGTNDNNENINSFKFIAIKVVNGEIKEILPK
ncbi:hypothetical protein [Tenacibaculum finnmarkense]|uniref:hypothetical protein n=1 Tax=Tenacibaculum finnmarkense TaxID=2781243 RepID=UPI001E385D25|nr:hypothetical protein [Tenacibaculum finnmarkense]MCD8411131.1 hypothetical protein [Tenacibaculum finnmarkense genomovar ulcerans]